MVRKFFYCILIFIFYIASAIGEDNTISYYITKGNDAILIGDYSGAIKWYDLAIEAGYQPNAPIFGEIEVNIPYGYFMRAAEKDNNTNIYTVYAEPIGKAPSEQDITFFFQITNPNSMQMKIDDFFIDVIKYYDISIPKIMPVSASDIPENIFVI